MAALAHASAILPMWGIIAAIVIWATQKDKSLFVRFQALQATVYQITMILGAFLLGACYMCSIFSFPLTMMAIPSAGQPSGDVNPIFLLPMAIPFAVMGIGLLAWFAFVLYGIIAAAQTLQGKDFRYLVIGNRLESYLAKDKQAAA